MEINYRKMAWRLERTKRLTYALKAYKFKAMVLVDENTANIRARTCVTCHNNVSPLEALAGCVLGDTEEKEVIEQVEKEIIQGRVTPYDSQLQSCAICGTDNKLAVWLFPEHLLKKEDSNQFPTFCFKKEVK